MRIGIRIKLLYYRYLVNNLISKITRSYKVRLHIYLYSIIIYEKSLE